VLIIANIYVVVDIRVQQSGLRTMAIRGLNDMFTHWQQSHNLEAIERIQVEVNKGPLVLKIETNCQISAQLLRKGDPGRLGPQGAIVLHGPGWKSVQ
jgi:hypothetical protein